MIYTGYILPLDGDEKYLAGIDLSVKHRFLLCGYWIAYGNRHVSSYVLCDDDGEFLEGFDHLQFTRKRNNIFLLETVD